MLQVACSKFASAHPRLDAAPERRHDGLEARAERRQRPRHVLTQRLRRLCPPGGRVGASRRRCCQRQWQACARLLLQRRKQPARNRCHSNAVLCPQLFHKLIKLVADERSRGRSCLRCIGVLALRSGGVLCIGSSRAQA